jgi:hypothetical protein
MDEAAMWCSMRTVSSKDDEETEDIVVARACPGGGNGGQHDDVFTNLESPFDFSQ